jgi:hypothetical protein
LNIEASHARKPYVEDEAGGPVTQGIAEEFVGRWEGFAFQALELQKPSDSRAHVRIVVDDEHGRSTGSISHGAKGPRVSHRFEGPRQLRNPCIN